MKKIVFLFLICKAVFASSNGYIPLSQFSDNKKVEYNFKTIEAPIDKDKQSYKKVYIKKVEQKKLPKKEEKISYRTPILSNTKIDESSSNQNYFDNLKVNLKFEYSAVNTKYSLKNQASFSKSSDTFSPTISLNNGNDILEFDYFMIDKVLETTWYKLKYKRKINDLNIGFGINKYELSVGNINKNEDYLSFEIEQSKKLDKVYVNYGGSLGKNSDIDTFEYFLSLGYKNSEIFNSMYLLGYKNKTIKNSEDKIIYSMPFIGVNTTF